MDFGMPFLLETKTPADCIALCERLNLQFIEWNMNFPQCQLAHLNPDELNGIRKEKGIYFTIHLEESLDVCVFNSKVRKAYLDTVVEAIELAKKIKAPIINLHIAKGIYITLPDRKVFLYDAFPDFYRNCMSEFRVLCEEAIGTSGIMMAIENTNGFEIYEREAIELLLESKCFGLTLDIGHSHAAKDVDIPFYETHREKLIHMHAHDAKGTNNHLAFGDGEIDLRQRLNMAVQANARVVLETKTIQALTQTVQRKDSLVKSPIHTEM